MPECSIFVVIDGGGSKSGAINWLRTVCHAGGLCGLAGAEKDIRVLSLTEFLA